MLYGDIFISQCLCFILCAEQYLIQLLADIRLTALHLDSFLQALFHTGSKSLCINPHFLYEFQNQTVFYGQQTVQEMFLFNFLISIIISQLLASIHSFYGFLCEFLYIHDPPHFPACSSFCYVCSIPSITSFFRKSIS